MDLEELYAPNHIERLKARSFLRSIAFFDDFSASFEYRDLFSVLENIVQFDYEKKPYKDDLYFLCKFVEPALKAIFSNLNTNICRKHLKMPLEKAREFDAKCVLYLAKRPGRSLREKLCDNKVLSVKRYVNANTHENRFLKRFIKELLRIIHWHEIEFQQVFEELIFSITSFLKSKVAQQIDEKQAIMPNNLLHFDKHYKRIFKAHDWLYNGMWSLMNLDQIFYLECLYQAQFYTSINVKPTLIRNEQDLYALIKNSSPVKDLSFEKMRLKAKEFFENELRQPINLNQEIPQLELCKGVYKEMYIDMFSSEPFALLVGNGNEEKILKLPLLAKKLEDNICINANGAKGEINEKGYLANALKDYDETLVEAFMRDFKERYKIEKLYYLLDDKIKNFEFAKIKHKISLYFKDAKFYPKSVALGFSSLFENKLKKNERLRYNGVDLVVKENHKSKTVNHCGLVLERQKSDDSKKALILQDSFIKEDLILENFFIKKALKNFKRALGLEKEGFILYKECLPKLSMEAIKDGRFENFEIIKDKTILGDKETLEIETPFIIPKGRESFALPLILNEEKIAYQGKITSKDFPLENDEEYKLTLTYDTGTEFNCVLEFKPVNNDLKPIVMEWQRIDRVELHTPDPIKKPSVDELKNDFNPNKGKSSDLFEWALEPLETLKDLNSPPRFVLERGIEFLEKKLECGGISKIGKDRNNELFYIVETNGKEVFCHSRQCKESTNRNELSQGARVCLEVFLDKNNPSKYRGKIYGLEKNREIVLLNTAKNNYQRKPLDEKIEHRIEVLKRIKYPQTNSAGEYKKIDARHSITNANISFHVRQILTSLNKLYEDFKINNGLSPKTLITAVLLLVILGLELFLLFKVFCYVFMTYLEKIIYLSLVIFMLPLGFFQQTRGFLVSYVKKIISLTFYMPLLLLLVLFNSFALQYAIKVGGSNEIMVKFGIIVVVGISLTFIQKVPEMINAIFGTQGGLTDAKSFVYQGVQIASAGAGVIAGSLKSVGRSAFGRTLEAYKDAKSTINSTTANMRDMPGHPGVRVGVETIELPKSHRVSK